ncbi:AAA family ATPase, partial [Asanoa sp. NPDC050611]|uniref:ATP-binding protein n=1 Tax=Asanoa sp. NPDC050611 TaxID=3157098 RepID=UPI00340043A7
MRAAYQALLRSDAPMVRHGVVAEPNPLLGRDKDVAAVTDLLRTARVTSIVGPGGLGKTRLAHAVADAAEQRVVHVVGLAGVTADADVAGEVASALGVRDAVLSPGARLPSRAAAIVDALGPDPALLVLDNCEHVVRGVAALVQDLVSARRELRVLTTSRAPLRLSAESVYQLPALDLPTMVELFAQRARATRPDAELPPGVVRELCGRLDGLPLAVELAAARVRVLSVPEIARRLDDRFALLRGSNRDAPERHHTLHAVIDWSWHLLEPAGQAAMRALSVFPGGFTAAAARHVLGADDVLEHLVDQSLLTVTDSGSGTRFRMLETVREFSAARLADAGGTDEAIGRFLDWARDFAVRWQADADLTDGLLAVDAVRAEQENLLLALRQGLDRADGAAVAGAAAALGALWITESNIPRLGELARETAWVLSHFRPDPDLVEVTRTALVLAAVFGFLMPGVSPLRAVAALRRLPRARPDTLVRAAQVALCAPDAAALHELSASPEPMLAGITEYLISYLHEYANEGASALAAARRMRASVGDDDRSLLLRALAYSRVGELSLHSDPGEEAYRNLRAALAITERLGWSTTRGQWALVLANLQRGAYDEAERGLAEAMPPASGDDPVDLERYETCVRGQLLLGRGDVEGGLRLWRQAALRSWANGRELAEIGLWPYEAVAVAVLHHAEHGRLDLVGDIVDGLPEILATAVPTLSIVEFPVCGSLLLALAVAEADRGAPLVALAERFGVFRGWTPALTPERITRIGMAADGPAYADAVSGVPRRETEGHRAAATAVHGNPPPSPR